MKKEKKIKIDLDKRFDELSEMDWAILARATNILRNVFIGDKKLEERVRWLDIILLTAISEGKAWNANLLAYPQNPTKKN